MLHPYRPGPFRWWLLLTMLLGCLGGSQIGAAADLPSTIERVKPGIVGVGTVHPTRAPAAQIRGTGFAVADGRHVLTNAHVISATLEVAAGEHLVVFVGVGPRPQVRRARQVAVDAEHDLAVLHIDGDPLPILQLGDSQQVREGEEYAFTGFPIGAVLGLYPATHRGIISARTPIAAPMPTARHLNAAAIQRLRNPYEVFQLDATAYPGNSGSPLYDPATGRVVGILNMVFVKESRENILEKPSGISYAIPARYARELLNSAKLRP